MNRRFRQVVMAAVVLTGSGSTAQLSPGQTSPQPVDALVVDALGVQIKFTSPPQRLVSLAPSNTELLFALGVGSRIVGVTEYCDYPAAAVAITKVASYSDMSLERVMSVSPDLVLAARGNDLEGLKSLQQLGVPAIALDIQTIPGLLSSVESIGGLLGVKSAADSLGQRIRQRVAVVAESIRGTPLDQRPRVMWGYWGDPIFTAGSGSLIDHLIREAGGINVAAQAPLRWPQVSLESVVAWAPDVLITTHLSSDYTDMAAEIEKLRAMDGWRSIPAVREGHVYYIEANVLTRSGPRMVDGLERLAAILKTITPIKPTID